MVAPGGQASVYLIFILHRRERTQGWRSIAYVASLPVCSWRSSAISRQWRNSQGSMLIAQSRKQCRGYNADPLPVSLLASADAGDLILSCDRLRFQYMS